ncbi:MAG: DUF711 family protein, partial [Eubacteriales bacterium]|nr:DUF711 family protein [Eubacteriales bacterium]
MINDYEILETWRMFQEQHLDVRTITMGISLLDCATASHEQTCQRIYDKICRMAEHLVQTGQDISDEYGIPIIHKRIAVTPIALVAASGDTEDYTCYARALNRAAETVGVNFIGGFSALVQKGCSESDRRLMRAIPEALATTELVCASLNLATTRSGINMDAVRDMGHIIRKTAELTADRDAIGCAKLVVFANAPEDNPFMAGAFTGPGEPDCAINVGVSGPGVVRTALEQVAGEDLETVAETIKRTAFKITRVGQLVARE